MKNETEHGIIMLNKQKYILHVIIIPTQFNNLEHNIEKIKFVKLNTIQKLRMDFLSTY